MNRKEKLRKRNRLTVGHVLIVFLLFILAIMIIIPFWNAIVISFMPSHEVTRHPAALWPYGFTWENYKYLFERGGLLGAYKNTLILTLCGTVYGMTISTMMGYAFSQSFPGKKLLFMLVLFTMYFSGGVIPIYLQIKRLGLLDSLLGIILMNGVSAWNIIVIKNGFESTPQALVEAGKIDGANDVRIFFQIMLPLQKPILATFSLFTAVGYWNEWYWSTLSLSTQGSQPLMVFLRNVINTAEYQASQRASMMADMGRVFPMGVQMSALVLTMLPIMCVYPFLQKYFMKGMTIGAVKM